MKIQFKQQDYQTRAVEAVADCFKRQPNTSGVGYRAAPGETGFAGQQPLVEASGVKNAEIALESHEVLENVQQTQKRQRLALSPSIRQFKTLKKGRFQDDAAYTKKALSIAPYHFDVEMETGTGKTYCYIKTIFEMNRRYGWSKFIIVAPSVAIREGVYKSLQITAEHFLQTYGKTAKFFIYNSRQLHNIECFASDAGINIMVINVQAFNARGKDNRRIYEQLDSFQSRRPIDVVKAVRPILILDEPQKMEGAKTLDSFGEFAPLFVVRYSATHKTQHNKVYRLDALDAYSKKLVKKIAVRGVAVKRLSGTNAYLYLESIIVSKQAPVARVEFEVKHGDEVKRVTRKLKGGANLHELSGGMDQYKGYVISDIDARDRDTVVFANGHRLYAGEAVGNVEESTLRRIQIREAVKAHFEKEVALYPKGVKVLTLFFIDAVAKYRVYTENGEQGGEYAKIFEREYNDALSEVMQNPLAREEYKKRLADISAERVHNGYFSIDKKSRRLIDPATGKRSNEADDVDAYDLILKDKERLLSFEEPTRFIFSHSALREGWDNPNVFVICALKHSDNTISHRQEVGRGLRLSVNQHGERQDDPDTAHQTNVLTVVAGESYKDFAAALQKDISESLTERPRVANAKYFVGKVIRAQAGDFILGQDEADLVEYYLIQNGYVDYHKYITQKYHDAARNNSLAELPEDLRPYKEQIFELIDSVYSDAKLPQIEDERAAKTNRLNANFEKSAFMALWNRINRKAVYSVHYDGAELVEKCVGALNENLRAAPTMVYVQRGEQADTVSAEQIKSGHGFVEAQQAPATYRTPSIHAAVKYDVLGKVAKKTELTRKVVAEIFSKIKSSAFDALKANPEKFISESALLMREQHATAIIERLTYNATTDTYGIDIFTNNQIKRPLGRGDKPLKKHIYDYVATESETERKFAGQLDIYSEVVVYAKLPKGFFIPTPVGDYNPDWAISFKEGSVKHIYFVAETKGSMSSMQLRQIEKDKIECARKFFAEINRGIDRGKVKYDVVDGFDKLLEIVGG